MPKKTKNEFKLEAERIRTKYAYLDSLDFEKIRKKRRTGSDSPSIEEYNAGCDDQRCSDELNGWMWEFLRRSKEYRDFNEQAENLKLIFEDKHASSDDEHQSALQELFLKGTDFFEDLSPIRARIQRPFIRPALYNTTTELSVCKKWEDPDFISIHIFKKYKTMEEWDTWMIPRYNTPYDRFTILSDEKLLLYRHDSYHLNKDGGLGQSLTISMEPPRPRIKGAAPYKLFFHNEWEEAGEWDDLTERWKKDSDEKLNMHINNLSRDNHTFTVVISRNTNMRDIETDLVSQIKDIIRNYRETGPKGDIRKRYDKWKYYLIAYDLIEFERLDPGDIANLFNIAFAQKTRVAYNADDIERYYSEGIKLIDKGKYKEYLFF